MANCDKKNGEYKKRNVSDDELWAALSVVFSSKSVNDTSYKFGFLKAIIDNLYNVDEDLKLTFDQLFGKFGEIYWNLVLKYGLHQKKVTKNNHISAIEHVLQDAAEKHHITEHIPYESLTDSMMIEISMKVKKNCKNHVVGALFGDTQELFYSFSVKEEWIQINPRMYAFICKHKVLIEKANYYEWAKFLEKVNDEELTTRLLGKIDESSKRSNLACYRKILYDEFESNRCFYCNKPLKEGKIEVDHFIPWSFIKDDKLWNLVLSCRRCNGNKKAKLPNVYYLTKIVDRNKTLLIDVHKPEMKNYRANKLLEIYDWAKVNGYEDEWKPQEMVL